MHAPELFQKTKYLKFFSLWVLTLSDILMAKQGEKILT